ncbi:chemotaxis protein CheW [Neptunomonas qingdaonensis]|uniref:Purine-binding chemotaxis protein CheW n=2 Tax=Neptunomonas qingdaonensis TaxID=1045558 RepID=A0A1I2PHH3_9GAMM|nr:purine-binding chemotaxis protein CheW [Neptunomonas qingdaonensis]
MSLQAEAEHLQSIESMQQTQQDKKERAKRANQEEIAYHQWATFKVNKELYGIDVMKVKEVLRYTDITPVPGAEDYILGIINLRGNVATVIDTRRLFRMQTAAVDDNTRIIMVDYNEEEVIGLVVDSVDEVINIPQDDIERAPNLAAEESGRRFVQGVCYYNKLLTILLDINKIMSSITPASEEELH